MIDLNLPAEARLGLSLEMVQRAVTAQEDTIIVALTYRCNSRCRFCIIETEIDDRLADLDAEVLESLYAENRRTRRFRRVTFSGAEVTLRPDLEAIARAAIQNGGFEVVRIQTNGRRLADPERARRLVDAGVREYFLSVHAPDAETDARITRAPRSFDEMRRGAGQIRAAGGTLISNTVICKDNADRLPAIAELLLDLGVIEAHFWSFLHIGDAGQEDQLVAIAEAEGPLRAALTVLRARSIPVTVKWFPACRLDEPTLTDNHQPQMLIRDEFQSRLSDGFRFGCAHAAACGRFGRGCDGLHEGYVRRFGDERALLRPL